MKKRIVSIIIGITLLFGVWPCSSFAYETEDCRTETFGGKEYTLIRGTTLLQREVGTRTDFYVPFYYSDGYFEESPTVYNAHLATASVHLATAGLHHESIDGVLLEYAEKHTTARQFLADIGCSDQDIYVNDMNLVKPTAHTSAVAMGKKELAYADGTPTGYTLVAITMRGKGYESEWVSNFTLGSSGEAEGFAEATTIAMEAIEDFLEMHELREKAEAGKVKFWLSGQSRGGAVANMTAKRLVDLFGTEAVYAYPLEAAAGGCEDALVPGTDYSCIHNLTNYADIVTKVAPTGMGFMRYGEDFNMAPADASSYAEQRSKMLQQAAAIDPLFTLDDTFSLAYVSLMSLMGGKLEAQPLAYDFGTDSPNKVVGDWMEVFLGRLQAWSNLKRDTYSAPYCLGGENYASPEEALRVAAYMIFDMSESERSQFADALANAAGNLTSGMSGLIMPVLTWGMQTAEKKLLFADSLWQAFHGAFSVEAQEKLAPVWFTLVCTLADFLYADLTTAGKSYGYDGVTNMLVMLGTLLYNGIKLFYTHDYRMSLAWMRSYDSYYDSETKRLEKPEPSAIGEPMATLDGKCISTWTDLPTMMGYGQKAMLDVEKVRGEAIYYTLVNQTTGQTVAAQALYQGGISIPRTWEETSYRLTAYAMLNGRDSAASTFYVKTASRLQRTAGLQFATATSLGSSYTNRAARLAAEQAAAGLTTTDFSNALWNAAKVCLQENSDAFATGTNLTVSVTLRTAPTQYANRRLGFLLTPVLTVQEGEEPAQQLSLAAGTLLAEPYTVTLCLPEGYEPSYVLCERADGTMQRKAVTLTTTADGKQASWQQNTFGKVELVQKSSEPSPLVLPTAEAAPTEIAFTDVKPGSYYEAAVNWAVNQKITTGVDETQFAPTGICTRAQAVTFLWRAYGCPEVQTDAAFTDVNPDAYYAKAVAWAVANGITTGAEVDRFEPDEPVTRAQAVTFLYRAVKGTAIASDAFADVAPHAYYAEAVAWAAANSITEGTSATTFEPETDCIRAQIVTFLYRQYGRSDV